MSKNEIPSIRFRGFDDAWEQRKLGELTVESTEYTTLSDTLPLLTSSRSGLMYQNEYRGNLTTNSKDTLFSVVPLGACTYRHMSDDDVFHLNVNTLEKGLVSREYPVFFTTADNDMDFIVQYINSSSSFRSFCSEQKKGGTRTRLYYKTLCEFSMSVPTIAEQRKISAVLLKFDHLITLHQRKFEKLTNVKKSMLEKMFPQNGADVPTVRFNGFEKPWQTIHLRDIASEITRIDKTSEAPIMMITAANGFIDQSDRYSFNNAGQSLAKYITLKRGELAYNHGASKLRPYGSCFALDADEARIPYVYHCFTISDHNPYFVSKVLNNKETEKQLCKLVTSGARMDGLLNISYEEYTTVSIRLPERNEQDKIVDYFKNLETVIDLCWKELDKLQSLKKGLLAKMFV